MPFSLNARQATWASNVRGVWKGLAQQIHQSASDPGHQLAGVNVGIAAPLERAPFLREANNALCVTGRIAPC